MASARKARRIWRRPAPRAFRSPISRVRSETETSITFMMPTPATASDTLAMPARARVRTRRMEVKAARTASWVMAVTSSSPWRSAIRRTTRSFARSRSAWVRTWRSRRKIERRLSIFMAVATGTIATSSMSTPSCRPRGARTPTTRIRQSPTRTTWPTGSSPGKSSRAAVWPSTATGELRSHSRGGRKRPLAMARRRTSSASWVEPIRAIWRRRSWKATVSVPITIGVAFSISGTPRRTARASSRVRSLGTPPMPGMPPVVSVFPGTMITRFVPMLANWPTT